MARTSLSACSQWAFPLGLLCQASLLCRQALVPGCHNGSSTMGAASCVRSSTNGSSPRSGSDLESALAVALASYVLLVLFGVVAWVQHLGDEARLVGGIWPSVVDSLPGRGGRHQHSPASGIVAFLKCNVPTGVLFMVQHSLFNIRALQRTGVSARWARLVYNVCSAAAVRLNYSSVVTAHYTAPIVHKRTCGTCT